MADITVRNVRFPFAESIDLDVPDEDLQLMLPSLALSMTMPYLEPYLIRTMKVAIPRIQTPQLAQDARKFSHQESHHFRNHANLNRSIRASFSHAVADALARIESDLEADYQRFSKQKSLRWNLAYAEGFEAMTCAGALAMVESGSFDDPRMSPGGEIWPWHMAEEIEHRTVAFEVFQHLVGSYFYRIWFGTRAQFHYMSYIGRFARCMAEALGCKVRRSASPVQRRTLKRYLHTFSPGYDPAQIELPTGVTGLLARYSKLADDQAA